jgi:hypothetical protein
LNPRIDILGMYHPTTSKWVNYTAGTHSYWHYQSVQRLPYYQDSAASWHDLSKYIITQTSVDPGDKGNAEVGYAYMGSSSPLRPGERLRPNRTSLVTQDWNGTVSPSAALQSPLFVVPDGFYSPSPGYPTSNHPSGGSTLGAYMMVPFQHYILAGTRERDGSRCLDEACNDGWGQYAIYDLSGLPEDGSSNPTIEWSTQFALSAAGVNWASAVKLSGGDYLAVARTDAGLEIYRNTFTDNLTIIDGFSTSTAGGPQDHTILTLPHQAVGGENGQILTDCTDGALYLLTSNTNGDGNDEMALYRLRLRPDTGTVDGKQKYKAVDAVGNTLESPEQLLSLVPGCRAMESQGGATCDFHKAGGAYVDPAGRLIYYGSGATNSEDPAGNYYAQLAELRYSDPNEIDQTALGSCDIGHAFFELYDQRLGDGTSGPNGGAPPTIPGADQPQSYLIDFHDRNARSFNYNTAFSFGGQAVAARYCIPAGYKYVVHSSSNTSGWASDTTNSFCGSGSGCSGNLSSGTTQGFNWNANYNWNSGCFMFAEDSPLNGNNCIADAGYAHSNSCAETAVARQPFSYGQMAGCAGTVTFDKRATLCGPNFHVVGALGYTNRRAYGVDFPMYDYWTNDELKFNGVGSNACWVSTTTGSSCRTDPQPQPMRVCSSASPDPLGNRCNWVNCALSNSGYTENDTFGGCNGNDTAGALCIPN